LRAPGRPGASRRDCSRTGSLDAEPIKHRPVRRELAALEPVDQTDRREHQWTAGQVVDIAGLAGRPERNRCGITRLTDRELEVFLLIGRGLPTVEIAQRLNLGVKTVETHREEIKRKLGLSSAAELVRHAVLWCLCSGC